MYNNSSMLSEHQMEERGLASSDCCLGFLLRCGTLNWQSCGRLGGELGKPGCFTPAAEGERGPSLGVVLRSAPLIPARPWTRI